MHMHFLQHNIKKDYNRSQSSDYQILYLHFLNERTIFLKRNYLKIVRTSLKMYEVEKNLVLSQLLSKFRLYLLCGSFSLCSLSFGVKKSGNI